MSLLSVSKDTKTVKGESRGYLTGILYLAPGKLSGYQVCPKASPGCLAACLYTAGRGGMNCTQRARIAKTKRFFEQRAEFMRELERDILRLVNRAGRLGMVPCIRLNGTSDIPWERIAFEGANGRQWSSLMARFPLVQFYDYTKRPGRTTPPNYVLTFSLSEVNRAEAIAESIRGLNVSAVFKEQPKKFLGLPVFSGDDTDLRFLDARGVVGLTAKGRARKDTSGFVQ